MKLEPGWETLRLRSTRGGLCTADGTDITEADVEFTVKESEDDGRIALWVEAQSAVIVSKRPKAEPPKAEPPDSKDEASETPSPVEGDATKPRRERGKDGK